MGPSRIRLVDIGLDGDFGTSMSFAQSLIQSMTDRPGGSPPAEIEFIRTRDMRTVSVALNAPARIIHVMAHGVSHPDGVGFMSDDERTGISLTQLAEAFAEREKGIATTVLFADCCNTAHGRFIRAIRDCLEHDTVYIGASRSVNCHESTVFISAFYGASLKDCGRGLSALERGLQAAERAVAAYELMVDGACPFKVQVLRPSRRARAAFSAA